MRLKHYHVLVGLPGYMPNYNCPCRTLAEAGDMAYAEAEAFREAGYHRDFGEDCQGKVVGNKREGYEVLRPSLWDSHEWLVWQTISIADCYEEDCFCQQCGELLQEDEPCYVCGWPLIIEEGEYSCTECGHALLRDDFLCHECGHIEEEATMP